ncbi:MAG: PIN domain-containing protein [Candidatus Kapaibacterium sp.]
MSGKRFIDTNIALYALDAHSPKGRIAEELLAEHPCMSTQVIMESVNVLIKKLGFPRSDAFEHARFLVFNSEVTIILQSTLLKGFEISERYNYSHWDSLIIASALEAGCETLYSEDMNDGQVIEA